MKQLICICLIVFLFQAGCGEESPPPQAPIQPTESAFDRQVRENCELLAAVLDSFHTATGDYPEWDSELVRLLPGGRRLVNPATGEASEPMVYPSHTVEPFGPGSVHVRILYYRDPWNGGAWEAGYTIIGRKEACDHVITNATSQLLETDRDLKVLENCRTVIAAAEAFALDNDGVYATGNGNVSNTGRTIQDYLPDGRLLENPYSRAATEPTWGVPSTSTGSTGYVAVDPNGDGVNDGYSIDGTGGMAGWAIYRYSTQSGESGAAVAIDPCPGTGVPPPPEVPFDERVRWNVDLVDMAAVAYRVQNQSYAERAEDLIPFLPNGERLINPAYGAPSEPAMYIPDESGRIGYRVIWEYNVGPVGYHVQGLGESGSFAASDIPDIARHLDLEQVTIGNCLTVAAAAEAFAAENGGVYAVSHTEQNGAGLTIRDYLPGRVLLEHAYTSVRSEPQWGSYPSGPGDIGYRSWGSGYRIRALGANTAYVLFQVRERSAR